MVILINPSAQKYLNRHMYFIANRFIYKYPIKIYSASIACSYLNEC